MRRRDFIKLVPVPLVLTVKDALSAVLSFSYPADHSGTIISADYPTGLASVSDGGYFSIVYPDASRKYVYQRVSSAGVLIGVFPYANQASYMASANAMRAVANAVTPLVDVNSLEAYFGVRSLQSRIAGAPTRSLNAFGDDYGVSYQLTTGGTITVTPRITDSSGGVSARRLQIGGADSSSVVYTIQTVPPGQWHIEFEAKCHSGSTVPQTFNTGMSYFGTQTPITLNSDTVWATVAAPAAESTTSAGYTIRIASQLDVGSAPIDIDVQNLRVVPGAAPVATNVALAPSPYYLAATLDPAISGKKFSAADTTSGAKNIIVAGLRSTLTTSDWTMFCVGNIPVQPGGTAVLFEAMDATGANLFYLQEQQNTSQSQTINSLAIGANPFSYGASMTAAGTAILGVRSDSVRNKTDMFINGTLIASKDGSTAITNATAVNWHGYTSAGSFPFVGDFEDYQFFNSALSDGNMAAQSVALTSRLTAMGLSLSAINPNFILCEGDSISAGVGDDSAIGWNMRPIGLISGQRIQGKSFAVSGSFIGNLVARQSAMTTEIGRLIAAGITNVICPILIGTNDAISIVDQASADTFYTSVTNYTAALKAAGAKVALGTHIPTSTVGNEAYDHTSIVISTGPAPGTYAGLRQYLRARYLADASKYTSLIDFSNTAEFTTYNATYYQDDKHPNPLGHKTMAVYAQTVYQALKI